MSEEVREIEALAAELRAHVAALAVAGWKAFPGEPVPLEKPAEAPVALATQWSARAAAARSAADVESGDSGLARIRADMGEDCRRCNLCKERRQIVFGVGSPEARLVIVGEAPGYEEDLQGEPFVGPAGQMLDRMLENVLGLQRSQVYICNVVKCRPPKNRNPLPDEVAACQPFLERQIQAIAPHALLVLGNVAHKTLFQTEQGITKARGIWKDWKGIPALPTFHPAYLLRNPADKRLVFDDLVTMKAKLSELA